MRGKKKKFTFKIDDNGCFVITSHILTNPKKAPVTSKRGRKMTIPRYVYEECFGEIPEGMVLRHKCDNHICVNPAHMETGSQLDNIRDRVIRGRGTVGEKNPGCKITQDTARVIRALQGITPINKVAELYNISITQVRRIWTGENWKEAI